LNANKTAKFEFLMAKKIILMACNLNSRFLFLGLDKRNQVHSIDIPTFKRLMVKTA